jgi:hypothetical protein
MKTESQNVNVTIQKPKGSVVAAMLTMFFVSLLLFWLPVLGPLVAGIAGGKKAGGIAGAFLAVLLPSLIFGVILFVAVSTLTGLPVIGAVAGLGAVVLSLAHVGPLMVGAIVGGVLA